MVGPRRTARSYCTLDSTFRTGDIGEQTFDVRAIQDEFHRPSLVGELFAKVRYQSTPFDGRRRGHRLKCLFLRFERGLRSVHLFG